MNAVVAQCGGPTPVINATLAAVVAAWQGSPLGSGSLSAAAERSAGRSAERAAGRIFGSRYGLQGLVLGDWAELTELDAAALKQLALQPAAALGGSRYRPSDEEFGQVVERLRVAQVGALFLIGGNGTMAAAQRIAEEASARGLPLQVLGIPKTIDNDLWGCDATPGYGSAARYLAHTTQEIGLDLRAMRGFDQVAVVEVMGRHVGWLAAATALARKNEGDPPHLILLPETPVVLEEVLQRIAAVYAERQVCTAIVAEGVRGRDGVYWAELVDGAAYDASGQRVFSMSAGASAYLVQQVQERLGLRCRQIKLNTAQRSTRLLASAVDRGLAETVGTAAVDAWRQGASGVLPALRKDRDGWRTELMAFEAVVGRERPLPQAYIDAAHYDVTHTCRQVIGDLVGELPPNPLLWIQ
jgi:6-phosphofructokinase 1